jgi:hypothetical protein
MPAIDTILTAATSPGAGPANAAPAAGDSLSVRSFQPPSKAYLQNIIRMGTTAGYAQVRSPLLHDDVQGIRVTPGESPGIFSLPGVALQQVRPQDQLIVELAGGTAGEVDIAALTMYYENLPGGQARLFNWSDVAPLNRNIKPLRVAVTTGATAGTWTDQVITTSENLLHANTDYAVLGYSANVNLGVVAIRGIDTGNLRAGGPGATSELPTTNFFKRMSEDTGNPWIPVINSANKDGTFVSVCAATASVSAVVELILMELTQNLPQAGS